jgi:hypothetical protein
MIDNTEFKLYQLAGKIVEMGYFYNHMVGCPHGANYERELKAGKGISERYLPGRMIMGKYFTDSERELMKDLKQKHFNGRPY